jgi:anion-transporting  ArsA/GET3 family ATPase
VSLKLTEIIFQKKIIILLGAGGVGKTTTAIAVALAAAKAGRKVALLSIDPAKRLAAALGIPLGHELKRLWIPSEFAVSGFIDAAMLDQKAVFDGMVFKHAPSPAVAQKILAQPLYHAASTNLSGPLEYMALARLQDLATNPDYDLVVLDTPPDSHALDFLARPNVLAGFMENHVMTWLVKPFVLAGRLGLGKLFSVGERLMGGVAKVTGVAALKTFGDFLILMQEVIGGFHKAGQATVALLKRVDTGFFLVTIPAKAAARSAINIETQLRALDYKLDALLFNRCMPLDVAKSCEELLTRDDVDPRILVLGRKLQSEKSVVEELSRHFSLITGEHEAPLLLKIPDQKQEISDLPRLLVMAKALEF